MNILIKAFAGLLFEKLVTMIAATLPMGQNTQVERDSMPVRVLVLTLVAFTLAACASNPLEVTISRCPAVAIVADTGSMTRFDGEGVNVENVLFTATISDVVVTCNEEEAVNNAVGFYINAHSDGRVTNQTITVPYFAVVLKDNSQIVTKRIFDVELNFDSNGYASSQQALSQYISTIEQARRYNYELLLGFQMDLDEVVYNMER
jgi:uncharacterized lipoprotein YmbA